MFRQPLTKGSWTGLVTLTAYMATKIGIETYLMDKFLKIHYQLEGKLLGEKVCQTKVHLSIGHIGHAETLVRSPRRWYVKPCMAGEAPPFFTANSTGVDCIFTLVLPCETFAKSSEDQLTDLQLLYILILGRTCLVELEAKHPILYIVASLFCYIPL